MIHLRRVVVACALVAAIGAGCRPSDPGAWVSARATVPLAELRPQPVRPAALDLSGPTHEQAFVLTQRAALSMAGGKHAEAIQLLQQALDHDGDSVAIHRSLGLAYLALGDYDNAGEHLPAADGDDVQVQQALGRIAERAGRLDDASYHYRTALICSGAETDAAAAADVSRLLLAGSLRDQGYLTAALDALTQLERNLYLRDYGSTGGPLAKLTDSPELMSIRQGRLLLELGRYDEALDAVDAAYRLNKSYPISCRMLAEALARSRQFDRAEEAALEMLGGAIPPDTLRSALLTIYGAKDDPAGPARLLAAYKDRRGTPPTPALLVLAWATHTLGDAEGARAMLADNFNAVEQPVPVALAISDWFIAEGRLAEAVEVLAKLLIRDPASYRRIYSRLSWTPQHYFDSDTVAALADAAAADTSAARHLRQYLAGVQLTRLGQTDRAAELFAMAIEAAAGFIPAYEMAIQLHLGAGRTTQAKIMVDRAGESIPASDVAALRGRIVMTTGDMDAAIDLLSQAIEADPTQIYARVWLAQIYVAQSKRMGASQNLQAAIREGRDAEAIGLLVRLHLEQYRLEQRRNDTVAARATLGEIRNSLVELANQEPTDPRTRWLMGRLLAQHHQYAQARGTVDRLMTLTPDNVRVRLLKVRVDARTPTDVVGPQRFATAMADLDVALKASPTDTALWAMRADILAAGGRHSDAAEAWGEAMDLRPEDPNLLTRRAAELRKAGDPGAAADALAELAKTNSAALILYATCLVEAGRTEKAIEYLRERVAAGSAGPLGPMVLMYALTAAGQADEALAAAEKAIEASAGEQRTSDLLRGLKLGLLARARRHDAMEAFAAEWFNSEDTGHWIGAGGVDPRVSDLIIMVSARDFTLDQRRRWSHVVQAATPIHLAAAWLLLDDQSQRAIDLVLGHVDQLDEEVADEAHLASTMRSGLISALLGTGRSETARGLYPTLLAANPDSIAVLGVAGSVYARPTRADQKRYIALMSRLVELEPDDATIKNNLAYVWADSGVNLLQAQRLLTEAVEAEPRSHIQDSLAWVRYKKGEFRPALAMLREAIDNEGGDNAVIYDHIGDVLWRLGRDAAAVAMWRQAHDLAIAELAVWSDLAGEDTRRLTVDAPAKIEATLEGRRPPVAPLGAGIRP